MISRSTTIATLVAFTIVLQLLIQSGQATKCDASVTFCNVTTGTLNCPSGYVEQNNACMQTNPSGCKENEERDSANKCVCKTNYGRDEYGVCNAVCEPECGRNEFCAEPNTCECVPGYTPSANGSECVPKCDGGCGWKEICQKPNKCACEKGYQKTGTGCTPVCRKPCEEHAECTEPDTCVCKLGYIESEEGVCEPHCTGGCPEHSDCMTPDKCVCREGFAMVYGKCREMKEACIDKVSFVMEFDVECHSVKKLEMLLWSLTGLLAAVYFLITVYCIMCCCRRKKDRHLDLLPNYQGATYDTRQAKVEIHRGLSYDEL